MFKPKLLLHACCAPCFGYVYTVLNREYLLSAFFYNPNIYPRIEHDRRLAELKRFSSEEQFPLIECADDYHEWDDRVAPFAHLGERSQRCRVCFVVRLERVFAYAVQNGFGCVATTLSISPHKDITMIRSVGKELSEKYGIAFLDADFKKDNGYKKSCEFAAEKGFYRQDYCGCEYSRDERDERILKKHTAPIQPMS